MSGAPAPVATLQLSSATAAREAAEIALIKAQREAVDPHRLIRTPFGSPQVSVYCNVSRRTEGTVYMQGTKCSYCGHEMGRAA